ncbi:penicillin acylase family protein [Lunatibacter salilacus]|uniref:penicillin acylase family protein n=1 Tax=Lunatibacter salilacus TaxID=2483804 RepID=UPI00131ACE3C|nr:penicillin acylase family protein [Lunatibacter salilacus]
MKKILLVIGILVILILTTVLWAWWRFSPTYSGEVIIAGLNSETEVLYDNYGIPHIYASTMADAYLTLGYVHAQERLFQMDMMRRVGTGTLAELLGEDVVDIDRFFRTLGVPEHAHWSTEEWNEAGNSDWKSAVDAYVQGVNKFIQKGKLPLEYSLLGHKPRPFSVNDMHGIVGYMSFTFAMSLRTDPLVTKMARQLGPEYLKDLSIHTLPEHHIIPNHYPHRDSSKEIDLGNSLTSLLEKLPVPLLEGSNGWVVSPEKTASGAVLFCNDTHIGFAQPSVWFEAHMEYPGFSFYGNHLAGIPFGLVGHSRHHSIGLTMFENDDQDFYEETRNPTNPQEMVYGEETRPIALRTDTIQVKGKDPVLLQIESSIHGPFMNGVIPEMAALTDNPVSSWWVYTQEPTKALEALWKMNHAGNIKEVEAAVRLIHAPGLNVMYGDKAGNIAWWAAAKLPIRPLHINSKIFIDGSDPDNESIGWIPFEENPMSINPPSGYVASANNQPDTLSNGTFYPGYYYPGDRWNRIAKTLESRDDWTQESIKTLQLEVLNENHPKTARIMLEEAQPGAFDGVEPIRDALYNWTGDHGLKEIAPTLYYKWLYYTLHGMMADELGEADFDTYLATFLYIRSTPGMIRNSDSPWWDNTETNEVETRKEIINQALEKSLNELKEQFGTDISQWQWEKSVSLEHPHPLGAKKPLDRIFNVTVGPVPANEESVNKLPFKLNGSGRYQVSSGPAMRIILDFANVDASESILPTGQSGNRFSPWYKDQASLYANGQYRPQLMDRAQIEKATQASKVFRKE